MSQKQGAQRRRLKARLLPVGCDLLVPGAFTKHEYRSRLKHYLLPCVSLKKKSRQEHLDDMKTRLLPHRSSRKLAEDALDAKFVEHKKRCAGLAEYDPSMRDPEPRQQKPTPLYDPPFSMQQPDPTGWGTNYPVHISQPVPGSDQTRSVPKFIYNGKEVEERERKRQSMTGDTSLDELLDLSFDALLQQEYPKGININSIAPAPQVEDATATFDWFDKVDQEEEDDDFFPDTNKALPLISTSSSKRMGWEELDDAHALQDYMHDNDSDIGRWFDNNRPATEESSVRSSKSASSSRSPERVLSNRKYTGKEDVFLSDRFTTRFSESHPSASPPSSPQRPNLPSPKVAQMSTSWGGTVTTAVMPTAQGVWVFVPQPPATEPEKARPRPQQFHADGSPIRHLKVTRSWNSENSRAKTTSPRNRPGPFFHYRSNQTVPMTATPLDRRPSPRRLFGETNSLESSTSPNPHNRIRALRSMILNLEASIDALHGESGT
jgi:hypothetical protein